MEQLKWSLCSLKFKVKKTVAKKYKILLTIRVIGAIVAVAWLATVFIVGGVLVVAIVVAGVIVVDYIGDMLNEWWEETREKLI